MKTEARENKYMSTEKKHRYFRITGGKVMEAVLAFKSAHFAQQQEREHIMRYFKATGFLGNNRTLVGLVFDPPAKPPENWKPIKGAENCYKPPMGKKWADARKQLACSSIPGGSDFADLLGMGGVMTGDGNGNLVIRYPGFENFDGTLVLVVPDIDSDKSKWQPPDDGCKPLKTSEYWAIKEAAQTATAP
jgi:hypothetical protein